jgi:amidohydrolase
MQNKARAVSLRERIAAHFDDVVSTRRALHVRPELSFAEHATTALIRDRMRGLGIAPLPCPTDTGGLYALAGGRPGRTILLRADIDGLPVQEEVDVAFRSATDGVMHACGHDAHTAILLGVAAAIADRIDDLPGRYVFLFQPAEERLAGARAMIEGGLLDGLGAEALVGCHVASTFPAGAVALRPGVALSDGQGLRFVLRGAGGHGAFAAARGNVLMAATKLVAGLGGAVDGLVHENAACACSAGVIRAGTAANVLPARAVVEGTLRTFTPEHKDEALRRLDALCAALRAEHGIAVELELTMHAPAVRNDPAATGVVRAAAARALGAAHVLDIPPAPPSDDVSLLMERVPGCFFFVGAGRADGKSGMHHSPTFDIDEEALRVGALVMAESAVDLAAHA